MPQTPLQGRAVVVTQAVAQAGELMALLEAAGAVPLLYPCLAIQSLATTAELDDALQDLLGGAYAWLVLTSANTVRILAQRLTVLGLAAAQPARVRVATVGTTTAAAVRKTLGWTVALTPAEEVAEGLADELARYIRPGERVLLPQAALARDALETRLRATGAAVTRLVVYETVRGTGGVPLPELLAAGRVDAVTLTSGSAFRYLCERLHLEGGDPAALHQVCLACIGPITAEAVRAAGFHPAVVAPRPGLEDLVAALAAYYQTEIGGV